MARQRKFEVQCINIRVHSRHEPDEYIALWKRIGRLRQPTVWRSGLALMIGESDKREANPARGFFGQFYQFVHINKDDPWFDISKHKPADEEDLAQVNIPANLRPNLRQMPYFFDVDKHRLYFISKTTEDTLSASAVVKLLQDLVSVPGIFEQFGLVEFTIAAEKDAVEGLLNWPVLNKIVIQFERPNPTDYEDEQAVFAHLTNIGAQREKREYLRSDDRVTLRPDTEMRQLAAVATDNGEVIVSGRDPNGAKRTASSQDYRFTLKRFYNPRAEELTSAFLRTVSELFTRVL